jgi:hypothetical protein
VKTDRLAYLLGLAGLVALTILLGLGKRIPEPFWLIELAVIGGALGITVPRRR